MRTALVFLRFGRTSSWNCHLARLLISYTCIIVTLITGNINLTNLPSPSPIHSKDDAVLLLALPLS
ncbi:hypothetical protein BOQ23_12605 [Listeria monocytogenes]|nr:hypothetical protein [Listeria monocytogenes]